MVLHLLLLLTHTGLVEIGDLLLWMWLTWLHWQWRL